jgi:hypothetical protein
MGLIGWLKRNEHEARKRRREWRIIWNASIEAEDAARLDELRASLPALEADGDDVEIELEMLEALEQLAKLRNALVDGAMPVIETHHRVIGAEACHFTAPASLPTDAAQPSGRVLFTPSRSLFIGGGKTIGLAWHAVQHIVREERDLLLARPGNTDAAHFRFNNYTDAVVSAFLARRLKTARSTRVL